MSPRRLAFLLLTAGLPALSQSRFQPGLLTQSDVQKPCALAVALTNA